MDDLDNGVYSVSLGDELLDGGEYQISVDLEEVLARESQWPSLSVS